MVFFLVNLSFSYFNYISGKQTTKLVMKTHLTTFVVCLSVFNFSFSQEKLKTEEELAKFFEKGASYIYTNKDSAYHFFDKVVKICNKNNLHFYKANVYAYQIRTSGYHFDLKMMKNSLDSLQNVLIQKKQLLEEESKETYQEINTYFKLNQLDYYYKAGNYFKAKKHLKEVYNPLKNLPEEQLTTEQIETLNSIYSYLTNIYTEENKFSLAENYCNKNKKLINKYSKNFNGYEESVMLQNLYLADILVKQKKYNEAISITEKALNFYDKNKNLETSNAKTSTYTLLISLKIKTNQYNEALGIINHAIKSNKNELYFLANLYSLKGEVYRKKEMYNESKEYLKKSIELFKQYRQNQKHKNIASEYLQLAKTFLKNNELDSAKVTIHKSLNNISIRNNTKNINLEAITEKTLGVEVLQTKATIEEAFYNKTLDLKHIDEAIATSISSINLIDRIKPLLTNKNDKQFLTDKIYPTFEKALQKVYVAYKKTHEKKYLEKAFYIIEKSKSIRLLEAVRQSKIQKFNEVPNQIIERELQLKSEITELEKEGYTKQQQNLTKLVNTKEAYEALKDTIKNKYKKYYDLKYNYEVSSFLDVERTPETLLSYLYGKEHIYIFLASRKSNSLTRIKITEELTDKIIAFQKIVSNYKNEYDKSLAFELYNKLIPDEAKEGKKYRIIPDGLLHYIPFETLNISINKTKYLIEKSSVSYANSFTLLKEQESKTALQPNNGKVLAVAPEFYKESKKPQEVRADFYPLLYNKQEVDGINKYFKTDLTIGKKAKLSTVKSTVLNYKVLHFATHASTNDEYPDFSYLAFTPIENEDNLWYVKEIYNQKIPAEMIALSACQTGVGKIENGEGSISLARAFTYAGALSIVNSLWKVTDKSTATIMTNFYKNLKKSESKDIALQKAKINFLENASHKELRHPYFWAGFVVHGNTQPILISQNFLWYLLVLPLLGILIFRFKKKTS